jgi:hypothetical protein
MSQGWQQNGQTFALDLDKPDECEIAWYTEKLIEVKL